MTNQALLDEREAALAELAEPADMAKLLGEDIIFGRLAPGARLTEDTLIARFNVTRHFVRQALVELERTGIVVREKNKGVSVRSLSSREVSQIYEVRELLQRQAALRIPLPAPAALIAELERLHEEYGRHLRARHFSGVHEANDAFHLTMFAACGNPYLVESIKHYMWLSLPVRAKKTADYEHALASERDHFIIIQLMKGTDSWALAQLCVDHLQGPKKDYLQTVANLQNSALARSE
ncbi:GntR family transcriptional regulator [Variovorax guangxiensis]|uniref:GntR family transcriptional regulator n=1 Tax=Variovorax guangxiensis TaxID=1775474 RepID=UPI00285AB932|nr:GntR family transcriptional regulator [Variovorax guangxiensis]MDR6856389.1 DNA-binding GntR family transcriptional regulator [Variovorax guangxiensis]